MFEISVDNESNGLRIEKFLLNYSKRFHNSLPYSLVCKLLREKKIKLNGKNAKMGDLTEFGNTVSLPNIFKIDESSALEAKVKIPSKELVKKIQNSVIYKDQNIIAINKPHSLAVQAGSKTEISLNDLLPFLRFRNQNNPKIVHRLDKDTSGLILIARNRAIAEKFFEYFTNRTISKTYLALVLGKPKLSTGEISIKLIKKYVGNTEIVVRDEINGKEATTKYETLLSTGKISLLKLNPITGRTHQIRVHLKEIGCPIIGDGKYNGKKSFVSEISPKLHLFAQSVFIKNYFGHDLKIQAEIPNFFTESIQNIFKQETLI